LPLDLRTEGREGQPVVIGMHRPPRAVTMRVLDPIAVF
jgi:hypothetical protein